VKKLAETVRQSRATRRSARRARAEAEALRAALRSKQRTSREIIARSRETQALLAALAAIARAKKRR
jgi:hypothetical protein